MDYLRRFLDWHLDQGIIGPSAFKCRKIDKSLSFHSRQGALLLDEGVKDYQRSFPLLSGDYPGVCVLEERCFVATGCPTGSRDELDEPYAEYHCELPCPDSLLQRAELAACAKKLLDFTPAKQPK